MEFSNDGSLLIGISLGVLVGVLSNILAGILEKLLETHFGKWRHIIAVLLFISVTLLYLGWESSQAPPPLDSGAQLEAVVTQQAVILAILGTIQSDGQGSSNVINSTATSAVQQLTELEATRIVLEATQVLETSQAPTSLAPDPSSQIIILPSNPGLGSELVREVDNMRMFFIPGGTFLMGSPQDDTEAETFELPQHLVNVNGFWIDKFEVTNAQYRAFLNSVKPNADQIGRWLTLFSEYPQHRIVDGQFEPISSDTDNHPVVDVSWYGADEYCRWTGSRLPTEEEWEYAARGNDGSVYPWGNNFDGSALNFCDLNCPREWRNSLYNDGYPRTSPVGSFPSGSSWTGIHDLAGNVAEWTANGLYSYESGADWASQGFVSTQSSPSIGFHKVVRGGSWANTNKFARSAHRAFPAPEEKSGFIGFRCVVSP